MYSWSKKSQKQYDTLHRDLQIFCDSVLRYHDCTILWGNRPKQIQNDLFSSGKSKLQYPDSKHNSLPSEAVDLIPYVPSLGGLTWDTEYSVYFCGLVLGIADMLYYDQDMKNKIRAGINWSTQRDKNFKKTGFRDTYHFELLI